MRAATTRIERDASLYFIGKAGAALGVFAAIPLTTRGLGSREFADFALWSAVALWSATACVGWLQTGIGRFHRERRTAHGADGYLATVRAALLCGAIAAGVLVGALACVWSELSFGAIAALGLSAAATSLYMGRQALAQADLEAWRVVKSDIVRGLALPAALVAAVLLGGLGVATAALAHAIAFFAAAAMIPSMPGRVRASPLRLAELVPLARYGLPIGLWAVVCLGSAQLGRVVLEAANEPAALALYAALQDVIVKGGTLLLMPIVSAIHANAIALWADGDRTGVQAGLRRAFAIQAVIGVALVVGSLLGADVLGTVLFGAAAPPASTTAAVCVWLTAGVVAANMGLVAHKGLELAKATGTMVLLALFAAVANLILSVALVPWYGAVGAAMGFAIAQAMYAVAALVCSRRRLAALASRFEPGRDLVAR